MDQSETSTTCFEKRCFILAQIWMDESDNAALKTMMDYYSFQFRLCLMVVHGFAEPTDKGIEHINGLWDVVIREFIGDPPEKIETIEDLRYWAKEGLLSSE